MTCLIATPPPPASPLWWLDSNSSLSSLGHWNICGSHWYWLNSRHFIQTFQFRRWSMVNPQDFADKCLGKIIPLMPWELFRLSPAEDGPEVKRVEIKCNLLFICSQRVYCVSLTASKHRFMMHFPRTWKWNCMAWKFVINEWAKWPGTSS